MHFNQILRRAALASAVCISPALAQDYYASVTAGGSMLQNSDNSGRFTSAFTTGAGTTIPAGTVLPAGTGLGWTTEFETGFALSLALGRQWGGSWRTEVEFAYQSNDIDTHRNVTAGGIALANEDAGVLITGSPNLGVTVANLVADGSGSVDTTFLMANLFYDFDTGTDFKPYIGGGLGVGFVNIDYSHSNVRIVEDDATAFAYQAIAGASYGLSESIALFAQYRYRATSDVETELDLFTATLDVENRGSIVEAGMRFRF